ncbi:MAG: LON peptidase substrate-binding domain-containing protein [Planctomycetes bacterium]|nr:LON peptidase substrate-binding domain-containing protein [Planctomycetota bacterium]
MASFEEYSLPSAFSPQAVRLFPLANLSLFPHVMQPIHLIEPRYCDLLEAALADDRLVATATLAPGWEDDYEGRPPLLSLACLGRIAAHHRLEDGSHNALWVGLRRVRLLEELPATKRFREARVEVLEDVYPCAGGEALAPLRRTLLEAMELILHDLPEADDHLDRLLHGGGSLGALTDIISYVLDIDPESKQALLAEVDVGRRAELLLGHLSVAAVDDAPGRSGVSGFPPELGLN